MELGTVNDGRMAVDIGNGGKAIEIVLDNVADGLAEALADNEVVRYITYIGFHNVLQDAHASVKREDYETEALWRDAKEAKALKKLDALYAGDVRMVAAASGSRGDEVKRVAMQIIEDHVRAEFVKNKQKLDAKAITDRCKVVYNAKTAIYRDLAASRIRQREAEMAEVEARTAASVAEIANA
jgi:hypothetical protein